MCRDARPDEVGAIDVKVHAVVVVHGLVEAAEAAERRVDVGEGPAALHCDGRDDLGQLAVDGARLGSAEFQMGPDAVSYTHLTLPTKA